MQALVGVILPVFLVLGLGWLARWRGLFDEAAIEALMRFAQGLALPVLLFRALHGMDLAQGYDPALLIAFYSGALSGFLLGLLGARFLFARPWTDSVAVGFCALFSNSLLLGLPITERAFGPEALAGNFAIISLHSPFCYAVGITVMEAVRGAGGTVARTMGNVLKGMATNPLVIGLALGFAANLGGLVLPEPVEQALAMLAGTALPVALFALGGILYQYRPEGDLRLILYVCALSLILHPAVTLGLGRWLELSPAG